MGLCCRLWSWVITSKEPVCSHADRNHLWTERSEKHTKPFENPDSLTVCSTISCSTSVVLWWWRPVSWPFLFSLSYKSWFSNFSVWNKDLTRRLQCTRCVICFIIFPLLFWRLARRTQFVILWLHIITLCYFCVCVCKVKLLYEDRECLYAVCWDIWTRQIATVAVDNRPESRGPLTLAAPWMCWSVLSAVMPLTN